MKFAVCFCIHAGELEIKALLLAASLRKHWPTNVELIACVPQEPQFGGLSTNAAQMLDSLGVCVKSVSNPINADYPIANKLLCLDVETAADRIIFLDSDILAMVPIWENDLADIFGSGFVAKPADLVSFKAGFAQWHSIYQACEARMPQRTVTATTSGEAMAPYFNAGVIAVEANSGFGRLWSECALVADSVPDVPNKRPHLDQIALPVAAAKSGKRLILINEDWNFPAHLRALTVNPPRLCHYHWPDVIEREPALLDAVQDLTAGNAALAKLIEQEEKWLNVFRKIQPPRRRPRPKRLPVGVITGIPRSGTSYLCHLLHALPGHVVINEPSEIFVPLNQTAPGHCIATYYRDLRRRILDGEPVENKTDGRGIIADTAKSDVRTKAPIAVQSDDFTLWTKNTLAYLNRLPQLLKAMPEATFVACVRHPIDTIASWARTFPHLRDAAVEKFPVGHPVDSQLSTAQRQQLAIIDNCSDLPRRRALLWNYLANIILQHRDQLLIVRLEDLAKEPRGLCQWITAGIGGSTRSTPPRFVECSTSTKDACATLDECASLAAAFGYTCRATSQ